MPVRAASNSQMSAAATLLAARQQHRRRERRQRSTVGGGSTLVVRRGRSLVTGAVRVCACEQALLQCARHHQFFDWPRGEWKIFTLVSSAVAASWARYLHLQNEPVCLFKQRHEQVRLFDRDFILGSDKFASARSLCGPGGLVRFVSRGAFNSGRSLTELLRGFFWSASANVGRNGRVNKLETPREQCDQFASWIVSFLYFSRF